MIEEKGVAGRSNKEAMNGGWWMVVLLRMLTGLFALLK
jgi:hypothetical protein